MYSGNSYSESILPTTTKMLSTPASVTTSFLLFFYIRRAYNERLSYTSSVLDWYDESFMKLNCSSKVLIALVGNACMFFFISCDV